MQDGTEDFNGPLDLILLLLSKNKIEIQDVSITAILEQYLAYLDEMKRMDMEIASEFIAMASHLMLIKTKMLLSAAEQAEALSEMELLIQSLQERQRQEAFDRIKTAAAVLEQRNELGLGLFTKGPEPFERDMTYRYRHEPADLLRYEALMAPEFVESQYEAPSYPLERCIIYDAGSRAFWIPEYVDDVIDYWRQTLDLAHGAFTFETLLKERFPELDASRFGQVDLQALCVEQIDKMERTFNRG